LRTFGSRRPPTPVIVPKANGKLQMCIDYTSLNKACPKDPYPLPRIDHIVDSTSGCDLLFFLDAYSGFHQIQMAREDRKHTAFVTVDGLYCYVVMPYGLRNALPTFVRAMSKTFVGAKVKTPPFARCLRRNRRTNRDKTTGRLTLRPTRHRTKTCDEVVPSLRPHPAWRPTCDPAHCNRP
jgi:hypothetical protein